MDPTLLIPFVATQLGIAPGTLVGIVAIVVTVANITGRVIPDTATGTLGVIRKIAKAIGIYVPNRLAPNASVDQIGKAAIGVDTAPETKALLQSTGALPPENGLVLGRDESGKFTNTKKDG